MLKNRSRKAILALSSAIMLTGGVGTASASFVAGDVVIYRVGTGTGALANTGNAVFLDEYSPTGTLVQSIPMPTADSGATHALVSSGTASSEGLLTLSPNGQYLTLAGYDAAPPITGSLASNTSVGRTIAVVTGSGSVDTSTVLTNASYSSGNNPRSVVTSDGTNLFLSGGAGGVVTATVGSTTATPVSTTVTNLRQLEIFNGQLYTSTGSGSTYRIAAVGSGVSTASGQTLTSLPGLPTTGSATAPISSPYAFQLLTVNPADTSPDTLYVADDTAGAGEIEKYNLVGSNWTFEGNIAAGAVRGLTAEVVGGNVQLFGTTGGAAATGGGSLYAYTDTSGFGNTESTGATATAIATASANEAFRGVAFVPVGTSVPEPASLAGIAIAGAGLVARRRRRA